MRRHFTYSAVEWLPVARELGRWFLEAKLDLEVIASEFLNERSVEDERAAFQAKMKAEYEIEAAAAQLLESLERHGINYGDWQEQLEGIAYWHEKFGDEARYNIPVGRQNPRRSRYVRQLREYWAMKLGRPLRASVSSQDGSAGGPAVRFLIAASTPVFRAANEEILSPEAARHFIRKGRRPPVQDTDPFREDPFPQSA